MLDLQTEIEEFRDKEYRESYADEFLNTYVANQIRVIREQRGMTQQQLAEAIGTKQAGMSRVENVNYSGWNIRTLKKIAHALGCRLHISFETYGSLLDEGAVFLRAALRRPGFEDDPKFKIGRIPERSVTMLSSQLDDEQKKGLGAKEHSFPPSVNPIPQPLLGSGPAAGAQWLGNAYNKKSEDFKVNFNGTIDDKVNDLMRNVRS